MTSPGAKFCIFFTVFVYAVCWENMNGLIFIKGVMQGKTWGEEVFLMSDCRLEGWIEELLSQYTIHPIHNAQILFIEYQPYI